MMGLLLLPLLLTDPYDDETRLPCVGVFRKGRAAKGGWIESTSFDRREGGVQARGYIHPCALFIKQSNH
jgi:hypothetical protein